MDIQTPKIIKVDDYHEFNYIVDIISNFLSKEEQKQLQFKEIGLSLAGDYISIFYNKNNQPNTIETIKEYIKHEQNDGANFRNSKEIEAYIADTLNEEYQDSNNINEAILSITNENKDFFPKPKKKKSP